MKKKFKMNSLDCANCAAKMEAAIRKIDGVKAANISFMTQRLVLEAEDERFEEILQSAVKAVAKIEPECKILR